MPIYGFATIVTKEDAKIMVRVEQHVQGHMQRCTCSRRVHGDVV